MTTLGFIGILVFVCLFIHLVARLPDPREEQKTPRQPRPTRLPEDAFSVDWVALEKMSSNLNPDQKRAIAEWVEPSAKKRFLARK